MTVHRDVDRADDLRHAIQAYEQAVQRRLALMARRAASSPKRPSRRLRRPQRVRPAVVAGLVLVVAGAVVVVALRDRREPVVDPNPNPSARQLQAGVARVVLDPGHGGHDQVRGLTR